MNKVESYVDEKYKNQLLPKNTIIFPKNGGAVLTAKKRILIQASLVDLNTGGLVPNSNINCKYLFYLFKSLNIKDYVKGSAVPTINSKKLKETVVPLPPLSEQRCWIWQCVGSWSSRIQMMNQPVSYSRRSRLKKLS